MDKFGPNTKIVDVVDHGTHGVVRVVTLHPTFGAINRETPPAEAEAPPTLACKYARLLAFALRLPPPSFG